MADRTISVSELTNRISRALEDKIGFISVQGEISNYKPHSSGHRYFTLKDEGAQISCTMWRSKTLNFQPSDGMKVIITGHLTVYPPRGQYQIECESMSPVGQGDLYLAYEALKKKLEDKGYFDKALKKTLPVLPLHIGVSTSETGAAVRDIFTTIRRRFPQATVYFRQTLVQGSGSAEDIAQAIRDLHKTPSQVIIIGRGGGSIEDLWSYNTEIVADAIFKATIPIVSAVGHETDFTIADFVADLRAATPTAGAEIVTPYTSDYLAEEINGIELSIKENLTSKIEAYKDFIDNSVKSYSFRKFSDKIKTYIQMMDDFDSNLKRGVNTSIKYVTQRVQSLDSHCKSLNPYSPLNRGFALLKSGGNFISNSESLGNFLEIDIHRKNEVANVFVNSIKKLKK